MKQALYRNYRPRSFGDVVGQEHIMRTLQQAVKTGRISHAYLFTGPRGVGKTSAARILAHEVNKLPYSGESAHLDIIEIDAASNRRIDEIRDLREKVRIAPSGGKYKVYIIDEVHMLTREAFNALLKTLEEPPAHVIFILATTEAHKLPETIISRTQRFEFKPIGVSQAARRLSKIADAEKIDITPEALTLLAEFGGGSFRDSISYLDQLSSADGAISEAEVRKSLGIPSEKSISQIIDSVDSGNSPGVLQAVESLKEQGIEAAAAAAAISRHIRQRLISGQNSPGSTQLLKQLIEVPASSRPYDYLEISLLEACGRNQIDTQPEPAKVPKSLPAAIAVKKVDQLKPAKIAELDISIWPEVIDSARQRAASIYTALRLAQPEFLDGRLLLKFEFPLHQKKLDQAKNKALVADLIESLTGNKVKLECIVDKTVFKSKSTVSPSPKPTADLIDQSPLHSINHVFGAAEVLEV